MNDTRRHTSDAQRASATHHDTAPGKGGRNFDDTPGGFTHPVVNHPSPGGGCPIARETSTIGQQLSCPRCGRSFVKANGRQAYCSPVCRRRARESRKDANRKARAREARGPLPAIVCANDRCSATFTPDSSQQTYCSTRCREAAKARRQYARRKETTP